MSDKIIDKIRKLLALAEGSEGNEAEVAAAKAEELIRKHRVDLGDLADKHDPVGTHLLRVSQAAWEADLAWALAAHLSVAAVRTRRWVDGERCTLLVGYGRSSSLATWDYLVDVARRAINDACRRWADAAEPWSPTRAERSDFRASAARRALELPTQMQEMRPGDHLSWNGVRLICAKAVR